jgi:hypothetical protein
MIKVNKGKIYLEGAKPLIRAELSTLIYSLINDGILTKEQVKKDVEQGFLNKKEIDQLMNENEKKLNDKIDELLKAIFE